MHIRFHANTYASYKHCSRQKQTYGRVGFDAREISTSMKRNITNNYIITIIEGLSVHDTMDIAFTNNHPPIIILASSQSHRHVAAHQQRNAIADFGVRTSESHPSHLGTR